jgi:hypothetical protein
MPDSNSGAEEDASSGKQVVKSTQVQDMEIDKSLYQESCYP